VAHRADHFPDPSSFTSGKPLGVGQITLGVGGIAVKVSGIPADLLPSLQERYAPFLASLKPNHEVLLQTGEPRYLHHSPGTLLRLEEIQDGQGVILVSGNFAARREGARGKLLISDPSNATDSLMAVENYLRWTTADLALDREGFVLHSAGLAKDAHAYVFFGPSGAGKSTIVSLSKGCRILSDDLVLITRQNGHWSAATTPFMGMFPQGAKDRGIYPLHGLYRLVQAPVNALKALPLGLAVGMAMACCPFVSDPAKRHDKLLPLVESCCRELGVSELRFRREQGFWELIER
jgi:hypothetical protein